MSSRTSPSPCPLCGGTSSEFHRDRRRRYERCPECNLVFVPTEFHLSPAEERAVYELHENSPDDPGYRRFLSRTTDAITARVPPGASGLDFGSGPGPTLSVMLTEIGYAMALYDPFFAPDESPLGRTYDFVTATEVVEHLRRPNETLATMWRCVRTGGILAIMTKMVTDREAFSRWHYKDDETHVCFFSVATFEWLGTRLGVSPEFVGTDVVLFERTGAGAIEPIDQHFASTYNKSKLIGWACETDRTIRGPRMDAGLHRRGRRQGRRLSPRARRRVPRLL